MVAGCRNVFHFAAVSTGIHICGAADRTGNPVCEFKTGQSVCESELTYGGKISTCSGFDCSIVKLTDFLKFAAKLDNNGYIVADESGKTSLDGLFAAGDVRTKALRQIITACSDGANCVDSVNKFLDTL